MTSEQRKKHRKKRIIEYAERIGNITKTCRYFGAARSTFYSRFQTGLAHAPSLAYFVGSCRKEMISRIFERRPDRVAFTISTEWEDLDDPLC